MLFCGSGNTCQKLLFRIFTGDSNEMGSNRDDKKKQKTNVKQFTAKIEKKMPISKKKKVGHKFLKN